MIGETQGRKEMGKMLKKMHEILRNWEKYKSFAFVKLPKKKRKRGVLFGVDAEPDVLETVALPI